MIVRSFLLFAKSQTGLKESGQNPPASSRSLGVGIGFVSAGNSQVYRSVQYTVQYVPYTGEYHPLN